jgi:8-oxo-dGTP pyrophosphatase MutT (NUDIX family)
VLKAGPEGFSALMLRRGRELEFFGDAFVFPGGKVDASDEVTATELGLDAATARRLAQRLEPTSGPALAESVALGFYVAACRELFEEAGILLAVGTITAVDRAELRRDLAAERGTFVELLQARGLRPRIEALTYWSHWVTPSAEPRRFDARFFATMAPADQMPSADLRESTELRWLAPRVGLEAHDRGELALPPPTQCTLAELATFAEPKDALTKLRDVKPILSKLVGHGDQLAILLPWDSEYRLRDGAELQPVAAPPGVSFSRFAFSGGRLVRR